MMFDIEKRVKPLLKWVGGKSGILDQIVPKFPQKFNRFIDVFGGAGSVSLSLKDNVQFIYNDLNVELVNLFKFVKDNFYTDLIPILNDFSWHYDNFSTHAKRQSLYYDLRDNYLWPSNKINKNSYLFSVVRTIILNKLGFNGLYRLNKKGKFNVPWNKKKKCPTLINNTNLHWLNHRLQNATITNTDFELIFDLVQPNDFIYCDPPYEPLDGKNSFTAYQASGFSQKDQLRLMYECEKAVKKGCFVAISNSNCTFIRSIYFENMWNIHEIQASRNVNSKGDGRGKITELLITSKNY